MSESLEERGETHMLNLSRTTTTWLGALAIAALCAALPLENLRADEAASAAGPATGPGAPAGGEAERPLQEVIVTATRREESLSKIPLSVSALSQADMDNRGIKDMQDM